MDNKRNIVKQLKIISAFLLFSFTLIVVAEVGIRIFYPQMYKTTYLDEFSPGIEDEQLGTIFAPNATWIIERPEFKVTHYTNSQGLADKTNHIIPKPKGLKRILVCGSSNTFSEGVEQDEGWPAILESELLRKCYNVDVVKAGMFAFDTASTVLFMERIFDKYQPNYVVISVDSAVILTNAPMSKFQEKKKQSDYNFKIAHKPKKDLHLISLIKRIIRMNDIVYSHYNMKKGWAPIFEVDGEFRRNQIEITKELLLRAKEFVSKKGASLVVLSIPENTQTLIKANNIQIENIDPEINDKALAGFSKSQDIFWLSTLTPLSENYKRERKKLYHRLDGHLNRNGHRIIGEFLSDQFEGLFKDSKTK